MSTLSNDEIVNIEFQDDVDSYPHRTNNANVKNRHNQLVQTVAAMGSAASNAETVAARPYHQSLEERLSAIVAGVNMMYEGGVVAERLTPAMSVKVSALRCNAGGSQCRKGFLTWTRSGATITFNEEGHDRSNGNTVDIEVSSDTNAIPLGEYTVAGVSGDTWQITGVAAGGASGTAEAASILGTITAPAANPRWDTVVMNSDNSLSVLTGSENVSPVLPSRGITQKKLYHIYLTVGKTSIVNADCTDARRESLNSTWFGIEPIGTIKAWHKSLTGVPALTSDYKECDGTLISDPESPMYRQTIPDLNGEARFLKGAATSGALEASANKAHNHAITDPTHDHALTDAGHAHASPDDSVVSTTAGGSRFATGAGYGSRNLPTTASATTGIDITAAATGISLADQGATEAVPKNMTVVWIMRIK